MFNTQFSKSNQWSQICQVRSLQVRPSPTSGYVIFSKTYMTHVLHPIFQEKSTGNDLRYVRGPQVMPIDVNNVNQAESFKWVRQRTRNVTYQNGNPGESVPLSQIEALIDISSTCEQSFEYDCVMAPLRDEDVDLAFWTGRDGSRKHDSEFVKITKNIYDTCFISNFSREID